MRMKSKNRKKSSNKKPIPTKGGNQVLLIILLVVIGLWVVMLMQERGNDNEVMWDYSTLVANIKEGKVKTLTIVDQNIKNGHAVEIINGNPKDILFKSYIPYSATDLVPLLIEHDVDFKGQEEKQSLLPLLILNILPIIVIGLLLWFFMFRQVQGSNNKAMGFGKSKARLLTKEDVGVTFKDVEGCKEAKEELVEVVQFLKDASKFTNLGAKIPKGVLLVGPPGTGKTLLAKAVAGEADVPFFSMSGSEFVEMFVGVGASRVRDLFNQGKQNAPCIIFIDELDAVGRTRGAGYGGGHDEREQTLNQMLVEMDGFNTDTRIIIFAATNRPDVLDPALLRPGRFDRQVVVDLPDVKGREGILKVHIAKIKYDQKIDLYHLARATPGFSGADLANMVNEAALIAARSDKTIVELPDFEEARDKVIMGPERRSILMSEKEKINTAYHEAGHTLMAVLLKETDALHKVTIIPRGRSLGATWTLPSDGKYTLNKKKALDEIVMLFGGRVAEEYKFGKDSITTGASNDIERATEIARRMVCEWGMGSLGPIAFGQKEQPIFLGKEIARHKDYSEETAQKIDAEIAGILMEAYDTAKKLIRTNSIKFETVAKKLLEDESLDVEDLEKIFDLDLKKRDDKLVYAGRDRSTGSDEVEEYDYSAEPSDESSSKPKKTSRFATKKSTAKSKDTDTKDDSKKEETESVEASQDSRSDSEDTDNTKPVEKKTTRKKTTSKKTNKE